MRILPIVLFLLLAFSSSVCAAPAAEDGTIDLSLAPFDKSGTVKLEGTWHFYWKQLLDPSAETQYEPLTVRVPGTWDRQHYSQLTNKGYGTYRLHVILSEEDVGRPLGIYLPSIASAFDIYIDGERMSGAGQVGTARGLMTPAALPHPIYFIANEQTVEIVLHVSNFNQRKGGMWDSMTIGTAEQINMQREQSIVFQTVLAAGLLIMGIYHVGLYVFLRSRMLLYFGLANLLLVLRLLFTGDVLIVRFVPTISWEISVKIEYLSAFIGLTFFLLYFYHLYPSALRKKTTFILAGLMTAISTPILFLPARIYTEWMVPYQFVLLLLVIYIVIGSVRSAVQRLTGSNLNLVAGFIFFLTVLNDIFYYNFIISTVDLVSLGQFVYIFVQMVMLSQKFASAYHEIRILTTKLEQTNETLELKVAERTEALQMTNEKLKKAEKARKDLLSNISHELSNPLTAIIGYLTALKDGVSKDAAPRHIQIAHQKALKLKRMTDDLRQLVKLEHDQLAFEMRTIKLSKLYDTLERMYDWEMFARNMIVSLNKEEAASHFLHVDLERIDQVVDNFISNAVKHTRSHDTVTLSGRCFPHANVCVISVKDTGNGIKKADQKRLFERFYRVSDSGAESDEGSGLGLHISKTIIEKHRGRIDVISKYGKGSTFYFILPLVRGEAQ